MIQPSIPLQMRQSQANPASGSVFFGDYGIRDVLLSYSAPAPRGSKLVIDKLEFFITVAKEQSFSRAAEVCGVTQPTLRRG